MIEIWLPWPDRALSPNAKRRHWRNKEPARLVAIQMGKVLARAAGYGPMRDALLDVRLTFYPPDRRRRDLDNLVASMKPVLDGIFMTLKTDDSWIEELVGVWGEVRKSGEVLVQIEEITDD